VRDPVPDAGPVASVRAVGDPLHAPTEDDGTMTRRIVIAAVTAVALLVLVAPMGSAEPGGVPARDVSSREDTFGSDVSELARGGPKGDVGAQDASGRNHGEAVSELARSGAGARSGALGRSATNHGQTVSEFARSGPAGRADAARGRQP